MSTPFLNFPHLSLFVLKQSQFLIKNFSITISYTKVKTLDFIIIILKSSLFKAKSFKYFCKINYSSKRKNDAKE